MKGACLRVLGVGTLLRGRLWVLGGQMGVRRNGPWVLLCSFWKSPVVAEQFGALLAHKASCS